MAIRFHLAMTAEEISENTVLPQYPALIYHSFPDISSEIPQGVIPVLTDRFPVDPGFAEPVARWIRRSDCQAVVLDFQRPEQKDTGQFARYLQKHIHCPLVVSQFYAGQLDCPVFLPPLPHCKSLKDHLAPWDSREIWMDICPLPQQLRLTEQGCTESSDFPFPRCDHIHKEAALHCHYSIALSEDCAAFTFWRTREDLSELLSEMEQRGIRSAIGLYGEWTKKNRSGFPERF